MAAKVSKKRIAMTENDRTTTGTTRT